MTDDHMKEPTCRACYLAGLSDEMRLRVASEPVTMPVHYCAEHKDIEKDLRDALIEIIQVDPLDVATRDFPKIEEPQVVQVDLSLALTPFAARRLREALARQDYHLHSLKFTSHSQRHLDDLNIPVAEVQGVQW